ncbi:UMP kinase [Thermocladium modestius]|uniref:UMP kinase n=1 Tax=Thermocladium modestius TaxID=62609 RepID=UPI0016634319|nr:UMP kinase [Thermocladium modestius]
MDSITIKMSGRIFNSVDIISRYIDIILAAKERGMRLAIVTGGGDTARRYIEAGRQLSLSEAANDMLGIGASRLNALLLIYAINARGGTVHPRVVTSLEEAGEAWLDSGLVVMGGLQPGQSTTMVSTLVSEYLGIRKILNCANVDGLYESDPAKDPKAKKIRRATIDEAEKILERSAEVVAGTYELIDRWALSIMKRSGISMQIIDGRSPEMLEAALSGRDDVGSIIVPW